MNVSVHAADVDSDGDVDVLSAVNSNDEVVTFDKPVDPSTVSTDTFLVERSGGDGSFGDGNEVTIPGSVTVASDGLSATHHLDPEGLTEVGSYATTGPATRVAVVGSHAYVVDADWGLHIVDVSDPTAPLEVGHYDTPGGDAVGVTVVGSYAYVTDVFSGLWVPRRGGNTTPMAPPPVVEVPTKTTRTTSLP